MKEATVKFTCDYCRAELSTDLDYHSMQMKTEAACIYKLEFCTDACLVKWHEAH